jgi:hypothetical protein
MFFANNTMIAAKELTCALLNPAPAAPSATMGNGQLTALKQSAIIFQTTTNPPQPQS